MVVISGERVNPLTAGAAYVRVSPFVLAHYISAFNPVEDKTLH